MLIFVSLLSVAVAQTATCVFSGTVTGTVNLMQTGGSLALSGTLSGVPTGKHGFHIHTYGDLGNNCGNAGSHYNPTNMNHGAPTAATRHVGDLGNVEADATMKVTLAITDTVASLDAIAGRALVLHQNEDDLGVSGMNTSTTTGNAGARLGCCIISTGSSTPITTAATTTSAATTATTPAATTPAATTPAATTPAATTAAATTPTTTNETPVAGTVTCSFVGNVSGTLTLVQNGASLSIKGAVAGLTAGEHGMHVHTYGSTANSCAAAGAHYNPTNATHGGPTSATRHVGDLGNIVADATVANVDVSDMVASIDAIAGRAIVIHALKDDLGATAGNATSLTTGNSGGRVACCVILKEGVAPITAPPTTTTTAAVTTTIDPQTQKPCDQQTTCLACMTAVAGCHYCTKVQLSSRSNSPGVCRPTNQQCDQQNNGELYDTLDASKCLYEKQQKCLKLSCQECFDNPDCSYCPRSTSVVSGLSWSSSFSVMGECVYDKCDELTKEQCEADALASRAVTLAVGALSTLVALVAALL